MHLTNCCSARQPSTSMVWFRYKTPYQALRSKYNDYPTNHNHVKLEQSQNLLQSKIRIYVNQSDKKGL